MGIKEFFFGNRKQDLVVEDKYDAFVINEQNLNGVVGGFKGEVEQKEVKFPIELGEEHPFKFEICEGMYKKCGLVTAVIDKYIDFVVGPGFYIECDDERAKTIIEQFMQDVNFDTLLRAWIKESLVKGNGFMEIGGMKNDIPKGLKVLNANWMYVKRDEFGNVEGYNQYTGAFKKFDRGKVIPFKPYEIAHVAFNKIGDDAYGLGIVYPTLKDIDNMLQQENDLHMLMNRKANSPYDVSMGKIVGGKYIPPSPSSVIEFGKKFEYLHNKHEWIHDGLTEIKALDFGNIGDKFSSVLEHDMQKILYGFQIPEVLMGKGNVPEGLAGVQMDAFERRVQSIQAEVEKIIEQQIFRRVLQANGFDVHVEFQWGRPSSSEKNERLLSIHRFMQIPVLSQSLPI